jgi:hypothetical protein
MSDGEGEVFFIDPAVDAVHSTTINTYNKRLLHVKFPATGWTTAAWYLEGRMIPTGGWGPIYGNTAGNDEDLVGGSNAPANKIMVFDPPIQGVYELRVVSGVPGATVNQTSEITIRPRIGTDLK